MAMGGNQLLSTLLFFLFLSELVQILHACNCTYPPNYPPKHPKHPPKHPPKHHHPTPKPVTPRPPYVHPPTPPYVHPLTPPFHPPSPPLHPPTPPVHPPTPPLHPPTPPYVCPPPSPTPTPPSPIPTPPTPRPPSPTPPSPTPTPPSPIPTPPTPRPPSPRPPSPPMCPIDVLKLGACVDLLGGLIHIGVGSQAKSKCCPLIQGLADLDAALCLCTTIRAKLLNLNIYLPLALELLITCGKHPPPGYQCPPLPSPLL